MAGTQAQASIVEPEKWLAIIQGWLPTEPRKVGVDFINSVMEAAAAGNPVRRESLERLDGFIVHTDGTTRSGREKYETLLRWRDKWLNDPLDWPAQFERARRFLFWSSELWTKSLARWTRFTWSANSGNSGTRRQQGLAKN